MARDHLRKAELVRENATLRSELAALKRDKERLERELLLHRRQLESSAHLAAIVQDTRDAVVAEGLDGTILSWNRAAERLYGFRAEDAVGKPATFLVPPELRDEWGRLRAHVARGNRLEPIETTRLTRDGGRVHVALTLSPILDAEGKVAGVSSIARDITERKRAEERSSRLNAVLEGIRRVHQLLAREKDPGRLLHGASRALIQSGGYIACLMAAPAEAAPDFVGLDGKGACLPALREMLRRGEWPGCVREALTEEGRLVRREPPEGCKGCPVAGLHAAPCDGLAVGLWHGGTAYGFMLAYGSRGIAAEREQLELFADVAGDLALGLHTVEMERERSLAEQRLKGERDFVANIIETAQAIILVLDAAGRIARFNPYMEKLCGYRLEEVAGKDWFETFLPERDRGAWRQAFKDALQGRSVRGLASGVRARSGETATVEWFVKALADGEEQVAGVLAVGQDVTERLRLQEQLNRAARLEAVGKLAGGVAHDFNNILTGIMGYVQFLADEVAGNEGATRDLEALRGLAERAAGLTRQLLAFGRRQPLEPVELNINDVVSGTAEMLERIIGEDIDLRLFLEPELGSVRADPAQIDQVLMNLAVNARDAMPRGGKLTIETANVFLDQAYADRHVAVTPGHYVMLAVTDTGVGMDEETREHAFEPFFTTKQAGEGTGLGLAQVYGIVKQHGGNVWLYSEPGKGTTVKVYLPRTDEEAQPLPPRTAGPGTARGTETVLVVEDEESVLSLSRRSLEREGYRVLTASSPAEAQELFRRHAGEVDLVVCDVVLPECTGRELCESLARQRPGLRVLYVSGYPGNGILHRGELEPGANFLQKPFTPSSLVRKVRQVLDQGRGDG